MNILEITFEIYKLEVYQNKEKYFEFQRHLRHEFNRESISVGLRDYMMSLRLVVQGRLCARAVLVELTH